MFKVLLVVILVVIALLLLRTMLMRRGQAQGDVRGQRRGQELFVTEATGRTNFTKPDGGVDASPLEFEVIRLLEQQKKINAIKLVRQHTRLGLKDAKDLVEEVERTGRLTLPYMPPTRYTLEQDELLDQARQLKLDGKAIIAIKLIREHTGLGLREAKEVYDRL